MNDAIGGCGKEPTRSWKIPHGSAIYDSRIAEVSECGRG